MFVNLIIFILSMRWAILCVIFVRFYISHSNPDKHYILCLFKERKSRRKVEQTRTKAIENGQWPLKSNNELHEISR